MIDLLPPPETSRLGFVCEIITEADVAQERVVWRPDDRTIAVRVPDGVDGDLSRFLASHGFVPGRGMYTRAIDNGRHDTADYKIRREREAIAGLCLLHDCRLLIRDELARDVIEFLAYAYEQGMSLGVRWLIVKDSDARYLRLYTRIRTQQTAA